MKFDELFRSRFTFAVDFMRRFKALLVMQRMAISMRNVHPGQELYGSIVRSGEKNRQQFLL